MTARKAFMLMALMVCGAIVTIAVAWGCCLHGHTARDMMRRPPNAQELAWWNAADVPRGVTEPHAVMLMQGRGYFEVSHIGHGGVFTLPDGRQMEEVCTTNLIEAGWPMVALRGTWFYIPANEINYESRGTWVPSWKILDRMFIRRARVWPYWPAWPGFAINTLFYAAILWMPIAMPGFIRRQRRIGRGLCPACAYPVGANELCTECGSRVVSHPRGDEPLTCRSFKSRVYALLVATVAAFLLLLLAPQFIHTQVMEGELAALKAEAERELGKSPSMAQAAEWFRAHGYVVYDAEGPISNALNIERQLSRGNLLWRPTSAKAKYLYKDNVTLRHQDWTLWRFDAGVVGVSPRFSGIGPQLAPLVLCFGVAGAFALCIHRQKRGMNSRRTKHGSVTPEHA